MKKLIAIVTIASSGIANAANWLTIATNYVDDQNYSLFEVDTSSIVSRDGLLQAWIRFSSIPEGTIPNVYPEKKFKSYMSQELFNCNMRESIAIQFLYYSGIASTGENIGNYQFNRDAMRRSMVSVAPGTYGETVLQKVCALGGTKK